MIPQPTITEIKDPSSTINYLFNWAPDLALGDTIIASAWTSPDPTIVIVSSSFTTTTATVTFSGGTGPLSSLVNRVTTAGGLVLPKTLILRIRPL